MGVTLGVAALLTLHAHPLGDDFCNAADARERGVWGAVSNYYGHWGGRWGGHIFAAGFPGLFEITRWYGLGLLGVLVGLGLSLRFLLGSLPPLDCDPRRAWSLSALLLALHWAGMPQPGQSVYWLEGAWIYSFNLALAALLVGALLRLPRAAGAGAAAARDAGLAAVATTIASFHELFGLVQLAVLGAGTAVARRWRDPRLRSWLAAAVGTALGLATVMLSPGNAERLDALNPEARSLPTALLRGVLMWVRVLDAPSVQPERIGLNPPLGWLDVRLLAATVLFAALPPFRAWRPAWLERDPWLWRLGVPGLGLAVLTGSFFAGAWGRGGTLPLRAFNGLQLCFLLAWFLAVLAWTRPAAGEAAPGAASRVLASLSAGLLALGLLTSGPVKLGLRDLLRGRTAAFDRAMQARYAAAAELRASGGGTLVVPAIERWPASYWHNDVDSLAPELQACVARYLGVDGIRIVPGRASPPAGVAAGP